MFRKFLLLAFMLSLAGCTIPGGDLRPPKQAPGAQASYDELLRQVNFIRITPAVLKVFKNPRRTVKRNPRLESQMRGYNYRVGVGDVLAITLWEQPDIAILGATPRAATSSNESGQLVKAKVTASGRIFYPYAGNVHVAGRTVEQIRRNLTVLLRKKIVAPQVDVKILTFRSKRVYLSGELNKPGAIPITDVPLTLVEAINKAGGVNRYAELRDVVVVRGTQRKHIDIRALLHYGDMSQNLLLRDGDVINVSRNDKSRVFVMGEVLAPGVVPFKRSGLMLADALAAARGIDEKEANAKGIFVIRKSISEDKIADIFQLDASNMTAMVLAADFPLRPGDVIYVTAAPAARWNRLVIQLLPSLSGISSAASTVETISSLTK